MKKRALILYTQAKKQTQALRLWVLSASFLGLLGFFLVTESAHAGQTCEAKAITPDNMLKSFELAYKVKTSLDQSQAKAAILARVGQDLSQYQLKYSHLAWIWKDDQGHWKVLHELNECGTARSALFQEGLANFFMDDLFAYEALILIPNQDTQYKMLSAVQNKTAYQFHHPRYNMIAYAFSTQYQNSNQWALEALASALVQDVPITQREQAQSWLKIAGYQPTNLRINATTRLGGRMFRANIAFDDHPFSRRMGGNIETVTVDSVASFLEKRDPKLQRMTISYP